MKRKALIVGVGDYGDAQPQLTASVTEAEKWRDALVSSLSFTQADIRMICDQRATKIAIMERLEWLLTDVSAGDQLLFCFAGHGCRLRRRNPNGVVADNMDEAIVGYPEPGQDIEHYSLYDDELARLVLLSRLPSWANLTFVLDCCFGGGIDLREPDQPVVRIPPDVRHRENAAPYNDVSRFGECRRLLRNGQNPVILASAPKLQTSPTATFDNQRRTVFGYHAIRSINAKPTQSFTQLRNDIEKGMQQYGIQNAPVLSGNSVRFEHRFLD